MSEQTNSDKVIARLKVAVKNGFKASKMSELAGISGFRLSSVINPNSYRGPAVFSDEEALRINAVLDEIKEAL